MRLHPHKRLLVNNGCLARRHHFLLWHNHDMLSLLHQITFHLHPGHIHSEPLRKSRLETRRGIIEKRVRERGAGGKNRRVGGSLSKLEDRQAAAATTAAAAGEGGGRLRWRPRPEGRSRGWPCGWALPGHTSLLKRPRNRHGSSSLPRTEPLFLSDLASRAP